MKYNKETDEYILSANEMCLYRDASTTLAKIQQHLDERVKEAMKDTGEFLNRFMYDDFRQELINNKLLIEEYDKDKNVSAEIESMTHRALDLGNGFNLVIEGDFQKGLKQKASLLTIKLQDISPIELKIEKRKGL